VKVTLRVAMVGLAVSSLAVVGCGSDWQNYEESLLKTSTSGAMYSPEAPPWVTATRTANDEEGRVYFVGRGIGYNTFDERAAYDAARDHVLDQLAKQVATWVSSRMAQSDVRMLRGGEKPLLPVLFPFARKSGGPRFLPGEKACQTLSAAVVQCTGALAGDLVDEGVYWEQWSLREEPQDYVLLLNTASRTMKRYKCWLRMSIDKAQIERRIAATLEVLKRVSAPPGHVFAASASHTTKEGAPGLGDPRGAVVLFGAAER